MRKYSSKLVDGKDRAPSRSMLRAVGFNDKDFLKPQVGIASTWSNHAPSRGNSNLWFQKIFVIKTDRSKHRSTWSSVFPVNKF